VTSARLGIALAAPLLAILGLTAPASAATVDGDFDGDGVSDLAIGAPGEDVGVEGAETTDAGAVNVVYGSPHGLRVGHNQLWTEDDTGIVDSEAGDEFGTALAAGDFDGDGFADLAIGAPGRASGSAADAGGVVVLFGRGRGLSARNALFFGAGTGPGGAASGNRFGSVLAAGDIGGGREDDLAIGVPAYLNRTGSVAIRVGGEDFAVETQFVYDQFVLGEEGEPGDEWGAALAIGDVGRSGRADLAIGVPGEDIGTAADGGKVAVLYGRRAAPDQPSADVIDEWDLGQAIEPGDRFGDALAVGELGKGSLGDLAVGAPREDIAGAVEGGVVGVFYGKPAGLTEATGVLSERGAGLDAAEAGDRFGAALAAGGLGRAGRDDLAVGAPLEDAVGDDEGAVGVVYGRARGLSRKGSLMLSAAACRFAPRDGAEMGAALAVGEFGNGAPDDLAVGLPNAFAGVAGRASEGAVCPLYGGAKGLEQSTTQGLISQEFGLRDDAEAGDLLGAALAPTAGRRITLP
jgi:FG-GAP repeat